MTKRVRVDLRAMADRMAALRELYESGLPDGGDTGLDQSGTFHIDASVGLASDASLLPAPSGADDAHDSDAPDAAPDTAPDTVDTDAADADAPGADAPDADVPDADAPDSPAPDAPAAPERHARPPQLGKPLEPGLDDIDASLSASLRATQMPGDVNEMLEDEDIEAPVDRSVSGQWGVREMRRRTAAGVSARSAQQKIDQLTAERDDLKIEVDFHRRKLSPDDVSAELIALRQEKLSYVRRLQKLNELVKRQDQALKSVNQQVKGWEQRLQDHEELSGALAAAEARADALERQREHDSAAVEQKAAASLHAEVAELERALAAREDELVAAHAALDRAERELGGRADDSLQRQVDEQHEAICTLQDALAAERLAVATKEGELDRAEGELEALQHDAAAEADELRQQLAAQHNAAEDAHAQLGVLNDEVRRLEDALREAHTYHEGLNHALKDRLSRSAVDADAEQRRLDAAGSELAAAHAELAERAAEVAELERLNERLNTKVHELVADLRDEEHAAAEAADRASEREAHARRAAASKDAHIEQLIAQLAAAPDKHPDERAAARLDARVRLLEGELAARDEKSGEAEAEAARLRAETRELASALSDATQARLGLQDRLETATAALDDARSELEQLRTRHEPVRERGRPSALDRAHERAAAERGATLVAVYDALAKALGDDAPRPDVASASALGERIMGYVRRLASVHATFEARVRAVEQHAGAETRYAMANSALRRQQEMRLAQLERVEKTIRAASEKQAQWRRRVVERDSELQTLQRANASLEQQLTRLKIGGTSARVGEAPAWAARLRELEGRVREADERVKRERAGARERAARDDARIRCVATNEPPAGTCRPAGNRLVYTQ